MFLHLVLYGSVIVTLYLIAYIPLNEHDLSDSTIDFLIRLIFILIGITGLAGFFKPDEPGLDSPYNRWIFSFKKASPNNKFLKILSIPFIIIIFYFGALACLSFW